MSDQDFFLQFLAEEDEEAAEDNYLEAAAGVLGVIVGGAEIAREHRNQQRQET